MYTPLRCIVAYCRLASSFIILIENFTDGRITRSAMFTLYNVDKDLLLCCKQINDLKNIQSTSRSQQTKGDGKVLTERRLHNDSSIHAW